MRSPRTILRDAERAELESGDSSASATMCGTTEGATAAAGAESTAIPAILPWKQLQKEAGRGGVDIETYIESMNAHIFHQRQTISRLQNKVDSLTKSRDEYHEAYWRLELREMRGMIRACASHCTDERFQKEAQKFTDQWA